VIGTTNRKHISQVTSLSTCCRQGPL